MLYCIEYDINNERKNDGIILYSYSTSSTMLPTDTAYTTCHHSFLATHVCLAPFPTLLTRGKKTSREQKINSLRL